MQQTQTGDDLLKSVKKLKTKILSIQSYCLNKKQKFKKHKTTIISNNPFYKTKDLYGVALCRTIKNGDKNEHQILMVCKKHTYAYATFLHMYYTLTNEQYRDLFNKMTIEEKMDIYSMNFSQMWYRIWHNWKFRKYYLCKIHFEKTHLHDGGISLKRMIHGTKNCDKIWEIPKGSKRSKDENSISCAIREFQEETDIKKNSYYLSDKTVTISYIDDGVLYKMHYIVAVEKTPIDINIFHNKDRYREISDIKWMNIDMIKNICKSSIVEGSKKIFKVYKSLRKQNKV